MSTVASHVPGAEPAATEAPVRSLAQRAADVFISPGRVMAELAGAQRPPWVGPAVLSAVVMAALTLLTLAIVPAADIAQFAFEQATRGGNPRGMTVEQMRPMVPIQIVGGAIGTAVWAFLRVFVFAGILYLLFGAVAGGDARFGKYRSVVSHAALISLLGFAVEWALRVFSRKFDLSLNLSLLVPGLDAEGMPSALLRSLNVFLLWAFVVLGMGVSAVNRKRWTGATVAALTALTLVFAVAGYFIGHALMGRAAGA
jgi:hypothetical protein